jgi:hypothetical protein
LEKVEGLNLYIRDADMLDGTPVLDIKPYIAYTDAHPDAGTGWLQEANPTEGAQVQPTDPLRAYVVQFDALAADQAAWIEVHTGLAIRARIDSTLALGPEPHPYRRIRRLSDGMQLAVKEWRIRFVVSERKVRVLEIGSGFSDAQIAAEDSLQAHRDYLALWPRG